MSYFSAEFFAFFNELAENNHKEWFHANKKRHEHAVKQPFQQLVSDLIQQMQAMGEPLDIEAKDCILRVNRDVRFSKDKSPYNLHCTAFISSAGRKDKSIPGFFLRCAADEVGIMGGCYQPDKQQLDKIRTKIASNPDKADGVLKQAKFVDRFGQIKGEQAKRLPKQWQDSLAVSPLIAYKQLYYSTTVDAQILNDDDLLEKLLAYWTSARPVQDFLADALAGRG